MLGEPVSISMTRCDPLAEPSQIRVLRTLGQGRAARARLVEARWPNGRSMLCVEKVFVPGRLTRFIYRVSFQSPFAYQHNRDAVLACFYRRRVAAAAISATSIKAGVAMPLYVRFDKVAGGWVLAAEWIDGRGIKPAPANRHRFRRWFRSKFGQRGDVTEAKAEIETLVETMHQLESCFAESGLVGSGWQVSPGALVSTANLLRVRSQYQVIDLESGIPAFLVPRYLLAGVALGDFPPFDDLDPKRLLDWFGENRKRINDRLGSVASEQLHHDCDKLILHSTRWKESELALLRRPWRLFGRNGLASYRAECLRRWQQNGVVDPIKAKEISLHPGAARWIWYSGLLPSSLGRFSSRFFGRYRFRRKALRCLTHTRYRKQHLRRHRETLRQQWIEAERIEPTKKITKHSFLLHRLMGICLPSKVHRFAVDQTFRRGLLMNFVLILFSGRYQSWFGQQFIELAIARWQKDQRISPQEANRLLGDLKGVEVSSYTRGLGLHLLLKLLSPILVPAKIGGVAAFLATGHASYMIPFLVLPCLRLLATISNWWSDRKRHVRHAEALWISGVPTLGSLAFPLQMFLVRPGLSTFLIRDAASKLGSVLPIYGGKDSRVEIAVISSVDYLIEFMSFVEKIFPRAAQRSNQNLATPAMIPMKPRSRFGRWLDRKAILAIGVQQHEQVAADMPYRKSA
ncbi:MAG: hypothetical protein P8J33_09900 [Pirellulaceae bacterium]|nr:hypothetical protein [Pirellulaceae bacterium]